jgi:hypothetical protein
MLIIRRTKPGSSSILQREGSCDDMSGPFLTQRHAGVIRSARGTTAALAAVWRGLTGSRAQGNSATTVLSQNPTNVRRRPRQGGRVELVLTGGLLCSASPLARSRSQPAGRGIKGG